MTQHAPIPTPVASTNYKGLLANTVYNKEFENPPKGGLTSGTLKEIKNKTLTLEDTNGGATTALITESTRIEKYDEVSDFYISVTWDTLEVGQHITVVGELVSGTVVASIVSINRIIPSRAPRFHFEVF